VKGPDFPVGAIICGDKGIKKTYREGKGSFVVRGVIEKESIESTSVLVIKEIPYQVIKADLVAKIAQLSREKIIEGISKVRDESNKKGIRVVIELKRDVCSDTIINLLYKHTSLQISLHISLLALKDNKPVLFSLRSIIDSFIDHRREVIYNRTLFDKNKAEKQKHIQLK
jgi:DNA gyrase subunit A